MDHPNDRSTPADPSGARAGLALRLECFVAERHPLALSLVRETLASLPSTAGLTAGATAIAIDMLREQVTAGIEARLREVLLPCEGEPSPGASPQQRVDAAHAEIVDDVNGFFEREAVAASFTGEEKSELLRGMVLTRATDNGLKTLFTSSESRYQGVPFQGKGFRSLGQEAIYGAALRLRRGAEHRGEAWTGDVVAPLIRDLGVALAMRPEAEMVCTALNAQMGKAGPPMNGRDLHIGALDWGILPAAAPLGVSSLNVAGMALGFSLRREPRVAVAFIGEGGTSLGEWHEAINLCAARRLPAVFCVQNNQTALSTSVSEQSAARTFADKAIGYGLPGLTIDGTDPEAIAAAFAWAAQRARAGRGPALIELVAMRMCGHAHHDDMLYLGADAKPGWEYPSPGPGGYVDESAYAVWRDRDPISTYARRLETDGTLPANALQRLQAEAEAIVGEAIRELHERPWPDPMEGPGVYHDTPVPGRSSLAGHATVLSNVEAPVFSPGGHTFLDAIALGVGDALRADPRVFVYGEDVGGRYGNAFLLLRPLLEEFGDRILNAPIAEAGVIGAAVGAALAGMRPIAEIQFNDFVATGFNQLVNNAAKIRYRWGGSVPIVVRMPWGGLRHAGPFHSQNTEAWFYRTAGLKIVVPSTPQDARALFASAMADPDPVLFYEHIALYRDPRIRQALSKEAPPLLPLGRAALRRAGDALALVSYGAYSHVCLRAAERLALEDTQVAVLDLRCLVPLDREALLDVARHCGKILIVHEDSRTGGIGESLACIIQEEAFEHLDAPVRVLGALDTPVPYSPPLEQAFLPSEDDVVAAARALVAY
jgi:pyruvate/2-oxoglutarate/acetoin dehydrogenase E1 component/TPP-dependent pyruvate/acetoin dehydrogenase alpha subunit